METREAYETRSGEPRRLSPGLVLLFAQDHAQMAPAYLFSKGEITIGRDDDCHVTIRDDAVSRRHARFVAGPTGWELVDEGSRNGCFVNGARVTRTPVIAGARVRFGDALFSFVEDGAEDHLPYGLDGIVRGVPTDDLSELVGGHRMRTLAREIAKVAPTSLTCLVLGETGTGKELVARALHRLSRRTGSLVALNCAAVPTQLFESEFFGYKRGAFSGADRDKPGLVHGAQLGTLFLDEIGEMPMDMQAKLLRLLQSREIVPLGATRPELVDVRVVAATHRDLTERTASGLFRADLLARLNEHAFVAPPLRERRADIFPLARAFVRRHAPRPLTLPFDVMDTLISYDWPANVRELESSIKRAAVLSSSDTIERADLGPDVLRAREVAASQASHASHAAQASQASHAAQANDALRAFHQGAPTEPHLRGLLAEHAGNLAAVARALGKRRMQIQRLMEKYSISPAEYRGGFGND